MRSTGTSKHWSGGGVAGARPDGRFMSFVCMFGCKLPQCRPSREQTLSVVGVDRGPPKDEAGDDVIKVSGARARTPFFRA